MSILYSSMQKILFFGVIILCSLLLGSFSVAFGEMMSTVGVASGDVFRYGYTCYFNSNDPHAVLPVSFSSINQTDYFMINVTGVSGASVNFETMLRGLNGSSSLGVCSMNVGTGMASISGYGGPTDVSTFYFMARNVGMMGRMFPSSALSPIINDTFSMPYVGGSRLTNHFVTNTTVNGLMMNSDFYFDQATGMMVQWRQETVQTGGTFQTNSTQIMKITSSTVWVIPEFPTSTIASAFIVGISVLALVTLGIVKFKRTRAKLKSKSQI
jgi:hypothetical protein